MNRSNRSRNPDDPSDDPVAEAPYYGAVLSPTGIVMGVPHALGAERPRPEPPERWTLGPASPEPPDDAADAGAAAQVVTAVVHPTVRRGMAVGGSDPGPRRKGR